MRMKVAFSQRVPNGHIDRNTARNKSGFVNAKGNEISVVRPQALKNRVRRNQQRIAEDGRIVGRIRLGFYHMKGKSLPPRPC